MSTSPSGWKAIRCEKWRCDSGSRTPGATSSAPSGASASAFERADANRDGQLSSAEAGQLPAIANRFQALDKDKNGSLSRTEFEAGSRS